MQNRKILTLEEVLNLDRQPRLQEMLDLSPEDYIQYLYEKRIIKYIPESGYLEDYVPENHWGYNIENDIVTILTDYDISLNDMMTEDEVWEMIDENKKNFSKKFQKDVLNETLNVEDYNNGFIKCEEEIGSICVNGKEYQYYINESGGTFIFTKNLDGSKIIWEVAAALYLENGGKI